MEAFYLVVRFNVNATTGAEAHSTQKYENDIAAMKRYYTLLATDIDNANYSYELVQVIRSDGICIASQVFDNRGESETQPEPEV